MRNGTSHGTTSSIPTRHSRPPSDRSSSRSHAGQHAWQRVVVMRDVITEDPGDAFSCSATTSGHIESKSSPASISVLVSEEAAGVVVGADAVDGRVVESAFMHARVRQSSNTPQKSKTMSVMVGTADGHRETLLVACVCLPPVYQYSMFVKDVFVFACGVS